MFIVTSTHARNGKVVDAQRIEGIATFEEAVLKWNQLRLWANDYLLAYSGQPVHWHTQMTQSPELYWETAFVFSGHDTWNVTIFQTL